MRFAWLFVLWSMVEIGLFVTLGGWIGVWATWGVVLGSGFAGILLIRWQKRSVLGQVLRDLQTLGDPLTPAAHAAMIVLAGVLLILPGFLTDVLGLVLLIPSVRGFIISNLRERARMAAMLRPRPRAEAVIDVQEVIDMQADEVHPSRPRPHKPSGWTTP